MMLEDEMCVLKTLMVSVDEEHALLVSLQYHSNAVDKSGYDRKKSAKRWYAVCAQKSKFKDIARQLWSAGDARAKMPFDSSSWFMCFGPEISSSAMADHLDIKLKKMVSWEEGMKILDGWQRKTPKRPERVNPAAKWQDTGYLAPDGTEVSLRDREALLKHAEQPLVCMKVSKAKQRCLEWET